MITILMATYNGERYLREQLDSLLNQTEQRFTVIISDDGSTDNTAKIAEEYVKKHPDKFSFAYNTGEHGAKHNFLQLMIKHKDDYIMLCDQDDVWLEDKIAVTLKAMRESERVHGKSTPVLVHTDLYIVDENLKIIDPSYKHMMNADYSKTAFNEQIIENTLCGCSAMYNRALADIITAEPEYCVMHDWWLILTAAAFGVISPIDDKTIYYRQHKNNKVGTRNMSSALFKLRFLISNLRTIRPALYNTFKQAECFLHIYDKRLSQEQISFLKAYTTIPSYGKIKRVIETRRLNVRKNGICRKIAQDIFI